MANPIPVFPLVGSTNVVFPGVISPRSSASLIMERAMRSFTELAGLEDSNLHTTSATQPSLRRFNLTKGVFPIRSRMLSAILAPMEREVDEDDVCCCWSLMVDSGRLMAKVEWKGAVGVKADAM